MEQLFYLIGTKLGTVQNILYNMANGEAEYLQKNQLDLY